MRENRLRWFGLILWVKIIRKYLEDGWNNIKGKSADKGKPQKKWMKAIEENMMGTCEVNKNKGNGREK